MTKKDFFILSIKLFGLYSIVTALFFTLPQNLSLILFDYGLSSLFYLGLVLVVVVGLFTLLLFKSHHIVKFLRLENGFDDDRIDLGNLSTTDIVKMSAFIIGGFLIIDHIPAFLNQTFTVFVSDVQSQSVAPNAKFNWAISGLNILLGYLMITNLNFIVKLLRLTSKDKK